MKRIIYRYWFYYVVQSYWKTIYTYAVCETEAEANKILDFILSNYD